MFPGKVSPHIFRHSKAIHLLESGVNLIYIRDFLGHSLVTTTEIYAKSNPEVKRKAIEQASQNMVPNEKLTTKEKKRFIELVKRFYLEFIMQSWMLEILKFTRALAFNFS